VAHYTLFVDHLERGCIQRRRSQHCKVWLYYTTTLSDGKSNAQNGNTRRRFKRSFYQVLSHTFHHVIDIEQCSRIAPGALLSSPWVLCSLSAVLPECFLSAHDYPGISSTLLRVLWVDDQARHQRLYSLSSDCNRLDKCWNNLPSYFGASQCFDNT